MFLFIFIFIFIQEVAHLALVSIHSTYRPILLAGTLLATCLLVWRLWRFTVRPYLRPHDPKELPYWIPCEFSVQPT